MAEVHLFAAARAAVGASVVIVDAVSLGAALDAVVGDHPDFAPVRGRCSFLIDGIAAHDQAAPVGPATRIDVLPPFSGG